MLTSYLISVNPIQSEFPIIQQFSYETGDSGNMPCIRILCKKKVNKQTKRKLQYSVLVPYKEGPLSGSTTEVISVGQVQDLKFLPLPHMEA